MKPNTWWTWFVLITILIIGTFLLIITPMGANYDEETHVARIWEMSLGHILPNSLYHKVDMFPAIFFDSSIRRYANLPVIDAETWKNQAQLTIDYNNYMKYTTRGVYFPTIYAVQAVLMGIFGRVFDLPILYLYYILRFSYLLTYLAFVYLTFKVLPAGKYLFGVIAMAPAAIIQGAAISADAFVFGVSFLFTGWVLYLLAQPSKTLTRRQLIVTLILILAVGTLKPNCIFLLVLLFVLPFSMHLTRGQKWAILSASLVSIAISASWSVVASQFFLARNDAGKDPLAQFSSILSDPLGFLNMFFVSIKTDWWRTTMQAIGISGYGYYVLPRFIYFLYPATLALSLFIEPTNFRLSARQSLYFAIVALFNVFMIYAIFFVIETEVWAEEINGVQGRYITPFFLLFFSAFLFLSKYKIKFGRWVAAGAMTLIAVVTAISLYMDYHVPCGAFWLTGTPCTMPRYKNWATETFTSYAPNADTKIEEVMTVRCNNLDSIGLWVTNNPQNINSDYTVTLLDEKHTPIRTMEYNTAATVASGWMTFPFDPVKDSLGKQFTAVITSAAPASTPGVEFGAFSKNEFTDGYLQINGNSGGYAPDLVIRYGCGRQH